MSKADDDLNAWKQWKQQPSVMAERQLIHQFDGMINARVNEFKGAAVPPAAVKGYATAQVVKQLHTYNPSKGNLATHVGWGLKGVRGFVTKHQNIGRIPEARTRKISEFQTVRQELRQELGREPDTIAIAERMRISPAEVGRLQSELRPDHIASMSLEPESMTRLQSVEERDVLRYLHHSLSPEERLVFEYAFGLYGRPQLRAKDIATTMGVSKAKISRIMKKLDNKIRERGV